MKTCDCRANKSLSSRASWSARSRMGGVKKSKSSRPRAHSGRPSSPLVAPLRNSALNDSSSPSSGGELQLLPLLAPLLVPLPLSPPSLTVDGWLLHLAALAGWSGLSSPRLERNVLSPFCTPTSSSSSISKPLEEARTIRNYEKGIMIETVTRHGGLRET